MKAFLTEVPAIAARFTTWQVFGSAVVLPYGQCLLLGESLDELSNVNVEVTYFMLKNYVSKERFIKYLQ